MTQYNLGIIGNGYVGQATQLLKTKEVAFSIYDIDPQKCQPIGLQLADLLKCDLIFVCVPTPMLPDGSCCTRIVKEVVESLRQVSDEKNQELPPVVIRSTVPPGTCQALNVFFMPEFLTEKNWQRDFITCSDRIFGLLTDNQTTTNDFFKQLISDLFQHVVAEGVINDCQLHWVTSPEAEMMKYFRNTYLATKVSFCNEIAEFCRLKNIDYSQMIKLATLDPRISASHTKVPGPDGKAGFGGTCFPKDMNALLAEMKKVRQQSYLIAGALQRNNEHDRAEQDWTSLKGRSVIDH